jgi:hypothetical protein
VAKQAMNQKWYYQRRWAAVIVVVGIIGSYVFASLAIDSGSLLQYFVALALLASAINRLAHIVRVSINKEAVK